MHCQQWKSKRRRRKRRRKEKTKNSISWCPLSLCLPLRLTFLSLCAKQFALGSFSSWFDLFARTYSYCCALRWPRRSQHSQMDESMDVLYTYLVISGWSLDGRWTVTVKMCITSRYNFLFKFIAQTAVRQLALVCSRRWLKKEIFNLATLNYMH